MHFADCLGGYWRHGELTIIPFYDKILDGVLAAEAIGVETMRRRCPLFDGWLEKLTHWEAA